MALIPPNGVAMLMRLPPRLAISAIIALQAATLVYLDRIDARLGRIEAATRPPASSPAPQPTTTATLDCETRPCRRSSAPS